VTCSIINNENAIHVSVGLSADFECAFAEEVGIEGRRPVASSEEADGWTGFSGPRGFPCRNLHLFRVAAE
jgi:hypothetical protein